jgi:hypothetical protein
LRGRDVAAKLHELLTTHPDGTQRFQTPWVPTAHTRGVRADIRRVAGCARWICPAGHALAGTKANSTLTFQLDHSVGADQPQPIRMDQWERLLPSTTN